MKMIEITIVINADEVEGTELEIGRGIVNDLETIGWTCELVSAERSDE